MSKTSNTASNLSSSHVTQDNDLFSANCLAKIQGDMIYLVKININVFIDIQLHVYTHIIISYLIQILLIKFISIVTYSNMTFSY